MIFITDREAVHTELGMIKGFYTYADLNRVESNVEALSEMAVQIGIEMKLTTKTNWGPPGDFDADSWPTEAQMARYLQNVHALVAAFDIQMTLPASMRHLTVAGANSIELALKQVYEEIKRRIDQNDG